MPRAHQSPVLAAGSRRERKGTDAALGAAAAVAASTFPDEALLLLDDREGSLSAPVKPQVKPVRHAVIAAVGRV